MTSELTCLIAEYEKHLGLREAQGVILYGSQIMSTADSSSDIDIIYISNQSISPTIHEEWNSYIFDVRFYSPSELQQAIQRKNWRNNIPLLALNSGVFILCASNEIMNLKLYAMKLWLEGTRIMSTEESKRLSISIKKISLSIVKKINRIKYSSLDSVDLIALSELQSLALSVSTLYQKAFGAWVYPPWVVEKLAGKFYSSLNIRHKNALNYLLLDDMCRELLSMCDEAIDHLSYRMENGGESFYHLVSSAACTTGL